MRSVTMRDIDGRHPQPVTRDCVGCGHRRLGLGHGDHDRDAKATKMLDPLRSSILYVA